MDDSLALQLIRLGAFLESKAEVDPSMFTDASLRQVVEGLSREKPDVAALKRLLGDLKCVWRHSERALDAIDRAIQIDADYERCKKAMKAVYTFWLDPKGSKQHAIARMRELLTEAERKRFHLD